MAPTSGRWQGRLPSTIDAVTVLRRLPGVAAEHSAAIDALLPDRWLAAHPQHRLVERQRESRAAEAPRKTRRAARRAVHAVDAAD